MNEVMRRSEFVRHWRNVGFDAEGVCGREMSEAHREVIESADADGDGRLREAELNRIFDALDRADGRRDGVAVLSRRGRDTAAQELYTHLLFARVAGLRHEIAPYFQRPLFEGPFWVPTTPGPTPRQEASDGSRAERSEAHAPSDGPRTAEEQRATRRLTREERQALRDEAAREVGRRMAEDVARRVAQALGESPALRALLEDGPNVMSYDELLRTHGLTDSNRR